jgi:hypothetical protein
MIEELNEKRRDCSDFVISFIEQASKQAKKKVGRVYFFIYYRLDYHELRNLPIDCPPIFQFSKISIIDLRIVIGMYVYVTARPLRSHHRRRRRRRRGAA